MLLADRERTFERRDGIVELALQRQVRAERLEDLALEQPAGLGALRERKRLAICELGLAELALVIENAGSHALEPRRQRVVATASGDRRSRKVDPVLALRRPLLAIADGPREVDGC